MCPLLNHRIANSLCGMQMFFCFGRCVMKYYEETFQKQTTFLYESVKNSILICQLVLASSCKLNFRSSRSRVLQNHFASTSSDLISHQENLTDVQKNFYFLYYCFFDLNLVTQSLFAFMLLLVDETQQRRFLSVQDPC